MRNIKPERELREIAERISTSVVERETKYRPERRRETTDEERKTLSKLAYGALLELNRWGNREDCPRGVACYAEQAALGAIEFAFDLLFPICNGYLSIYSPIKDVLREWEDEAWNTKVRDWYVSEYHDDDLGLELNPETTFREVDDTLRKRQDVYSVMGVGDSVIRERVFERLAKIADVPYQEIYDRWLRAA